MRSRCLTSILFGVLGMVLVSSCHVRVRPGVGVYTDGGYVGGYVTVDPPAPRLEVIGSAPAPGYVWIDGYWGWDNGAYAWRQGRWERPRSGYRWVPHRWQRDSGGWRLSAGYWQRY